MAHLTYYQLQELAGGSLPGAERDVLEKHVSSCRRCERELMFQKSLHKAIKDAPLVRTSKRFTERVMDRILPDRRESWFLKFFEGAGRIIAMFLVLGIVAYALTRFPSGITTDAKAAEQSEAVKTFLQYYNQTKQFLGQGSTQMSRAVVQQTSTEQSRVLVMVFVSVVVLVLLDRYVLRRILKLKT